MPSLRHEVRLAARTDPAMGTRRRTLSSSIGAVVAVMPMTVAAHADRVVTPEEAWRTWRLDPVISVALVLLGWMYWRGASRANRVAASAGREPVFSTNRQVAFWAGWVTLFVALDSPLDLATGTVFSAHMVQHMLLIAVAPPLLLLGRPLPALANALPRAWRGHISGLTHPLTQATGWLARPLPAWIVASSFLWIWHEPGLYQAAVRHEWVHFAEHLTFLFTALLFWWAIVTTVPRARALSPGMAMLSLFGMGMQGAALGALLTFSGSLWYPIYEGRSGLWHLSAMSDQTLAGLIMWIPAGSVYVVAALVVLGRWFAEDANPDAAVPAPPAPVPGTGIRA